MTFCHFHSTSPFVITFFSWFEDESDRFIEWQVTQFAVEDNLLCAAIISCAGKGDFSRFARFEFEFCGEYPPSTVTATLLLIFDPNILVSPFK